MGSPATSPAGRWIVRWQPRPSARLRMFCFPYAGGAASAYRGWPGDLPETVDVCAVQLPGRESRIAETAPHTLARAVPAITAALRPMLDIPYVFFGHSMGGLLAFEIAREFRQAGYPDPVHLVVSGRHAPQLPNRGPPIHGLPTPLFLQAIREYGGTPADVFENEQLVDLVLPALRADFTLVENYVFEPGVRLGVPISAFYGDGDTAVGRADAAAWQEQTTGSFSLHGLPGGHFFLRTAHRQLLRQITADLMHVLQPR